MAPAEPQRNVNQPLKQAAPVGCSPPVVAQRVRRLLGGKWLRRVTLLGHSRATNFQRCLAERGFTIDMAEGENLAGVIAEWLVEALAEEEAPLAMGVVVGGGVPPSSGAGGAGRDLEGMVLETADREVRGLDGDKTRFVGARKAGGAGGGHGGSGGDHLGGEAGTLLAAMARMLGQKNAPAPAPFTPSTGRLMRAKGRALSGRAVPVEI